MTACGACLRRTWLLGRLAGHLELARRGGARPGGRLRAVLALGDAALIDALAGDAASQLARAFTDVDPRRLRDAATRAGLALVCRHDDAYPPRLRDLEDAPAVLHVAGDPRRLHGLVGGTVDAGARAVAVVGTRRASAEGLEMARELGRGLAAAGITVVSGMALGVDSAAHAGALEAAGPTVAVLAGGADRASPASKRALHQAIVARHCVVSELPPGFVPHRWCFPARNRTIAALAAATVVVEAADRSGSLITAEVAADLGREVAAVPGSPLAWRSAGTNALLRDGATLVRDARDVLDAVLGVAPRNAAGVAAGSAARASDPLARFGGIEPALREVLAAVVAGRDTVAALAPSPADVGPVVAALSELELLGALSRVAGGRYVVPHAGGRG